MSVAVLERPVVTESVPVDVARVEINSHCQCFVCPECSLGYIGGGGECECCPAVLVPSGDCTGACFESEVEYLGEAVAGWFAANPAGTGGYRIDGRNMGWRRLSGVCELAGPVGGSDLIHKLCGSAGEYTQQWVVEPVAGGRFECVQYHHDAPMGESYTVSVK